MLEGLGEWKITAFLSLITICFSFAKKLQLPFFSQKSAILDSVNIEVTSLPSASPIMTSSTPSPSTSTRRIHDSVPIPPREEEHWYRLLSWNHMSHRLRKSTICLGENKAQISFAVTFVFAPRIVQSLFYLNQKFQASRLLLWMYRLVCVRPGRNSKLLVFSCTGSYNRLIASAG